MLNIKCIKQLCVTLLLIGSCFAVNSTEFETFKTALDKFQGEQEQLDFVVKLQSTAQAWPLQELARFYHQKGLVLEANDQIEAAKAAYTQSIETFVEYDVPSGYWVQSLQDRSYMDYLLTNEPSKYCEDRRTAVDVARKTEDPNVKTSALVFLAFCYQDGFEGFKQGLEVLEEAAAVAKQYNLAADASAMIHNATGNLYRTNQIEDKAYEYYQKAYDHWAPLDDTQDMFNMQHNLVGQSIKMGGWETAEKHIKILSELTETSPDFSDFRFFTLYNQAKLFYAKNEFESAINTSATALDLAHTTSEKYFIKDLQGSQIVAYFRNGQTDLAGELAATYLAADDLSPRQQALNNQVKLIHAYFRGDYSSTVSTFWQLLDESRSSKYAFIKNSVALQSLQFDQTMSEIQEQALASKLKISELELEKSTKQNKINQLTGIAAILLAAIFIATSWYLYKSRRFYLLSSRTDFLTRCNNRRRIFELGAKQFEESQKHQQAFSVAILDIDDFKHINDQYGHDLGDQVLIQLVLNVKSILSENQNVGRMGGEEFLITMPNTSAEDAKLQAEKIRLAIAESTIIHQHSAVKFSVSIGVIAKKDHKSSFEKMVKQADLALYSAKSSGKNQVNLYGAM